MQQLSLDESQPSDPLNELEEKYRIWKATHLPVFEMFETFALQLLTKHRRFGIRMISERVRWEVKTTWDVDADGFKINDHLTPYIARDLIAKYPAFAELIETRKVRGEEDEELVW